MDTLLLPEHEEEEIKYVEEGPSVPDGEKAEVMEIYEGNNQIFIDIIIERFDYQIQRKWRR